MAKATKKATLKIKQPEPKVIRKIDALYPRTISIELFTQWQRMTRQGDIKELVRVTKKSPPTIVRALTYGCVRKESLKEIINDFFNKRIAKEKAQAEKFEQAQ
jgi:hypothetical protein